MNKVHLAEELSGRVGVSRAQAEKMLEEFTKVVTEKLIQGEEVVLAGFGAFSSRKRKGRIGVNPRNVSEQIEIPAVTVAKFKAGKNLKDALKRGTEAPAPTEEATEEPTPASPEEGGAEEASSSAEATEDRPVEEAPAEPAVEPEAPVEEEERPEGTHSF